MAEAKYALKYLFDVAVETKREAQGYRYKTMQEDNKFEELLTVHEDTVKRLNELEHKLLEINLEHKKGLSEVERQNEERVCCMTICQFLLNGACQFQWPLLGEFNNFCNEEEERCAQYSKT